MMMYVAVLSLVTASLFGMTVSDDDTWKAFHARMKAFDTTLDYTQVRMAYAASSAYQPSASYAGELLERASAAVEAKELGRARNVIDSAIMHQPLYSDGYAAKAWVLNELGETDSARMYTRVMNELMESLTRSGNGRSAATAMIVIDANEEYSYIAAFGLSVVNQGLVVVEGRSYDVLTCTTPDNETVKIWFDVDIPMARMARMLEE